MEIPAEPGSYIIFGRLADEVCFTSGLFSGQLLTRGYYLYTGSAFGPGGLRARIARHLKPGTKKFWHFDYLKALIQIEEIWYSPGGKNQECQFIKALQDLDYSSFPFLKFGSSDCRHGCQAHLVRFPLETNMDIAYDHLHKYGFSINIISLK
ncbi:MAG: GIY-YIG nuclease family protein [Pelolinea sp.]|nr:GIY-YIG nuclease family protein [Pelolinea sp.]